MRLGSEKAVELLESQTLIQRTVSGLYGFGQETIVVTAPGKTMLGMESFPKVRLVQDAVPGKGPLVGIYSGLLASKSPLNLIVACDMPFLNIRLLSYMVGQAGGSEAVVPRFGGLVEPLHAIYSRSCLSAALELINNNVFAVSKLLNRIKVRYIEETEINRFDPGHMSFFNINRPEDLRKAKLLISKRQDEELDHRLSFRTAIKESLS